MCDSRRAVLLISAATGMAPERCSTSVVSARWCSCGPLTAIRSQRHTRASGGRDSQPCVRPTGYFRACHRAYLVMYVASSYEHSTSGIHAKSTSKNWAGSDSIDAPVSTIVCQRHCGQTQTGGRFAQGREGTWPQLHDSVAALHFAALRPRHTGRPVSAAAGHSGGGE